MLIGYYLWWTEELAACFRGLGVQDTGTTPDTTTTGNLTWQEQLVVFFEGLGSDGIQDMVWDIYYIRVQPEIKSNERHLNRIIRSPF